MKKLKLLSLLLILIGLSSQANAASLITVLMSLVKCGTQQGIVAWNGTAFICATIGTGLALSPTGILSSSSTVTPPPPALIWNVETVSLTAVIGGATSTTYTTLKPLAGNGILLWFYNSQSLSSSGSGAIAGASNPITFTLPTGWSSADSITLVYQSTQQ